jgi:predicted nucleotidyltransferase
MTLDIDALAEICVRNDIGRLRVFGSFARGDQGKGSDVDFIADFTSRKSLLDLVRIEREFSERIGRRVDLLTEAAISPHLRERILQDAKVIYERAA